MVGPDPVGQPLHLGGVEVVDDRSDALAAELGDKLGGLLDGLGAGIVGANGAALVAGAAARADVRDYLDERINLGKAAELLHLTRFELDASFQRLGIPLRRGARSIEDAQAEIAAARKHA